MDLFNILWALFWFALLGAVFGGALALAAKRLKTGGDDQAAKIRDLLSGANCGACGYAGCALFAEAAASGVALTSSCAAGGAELAERITAITGGAAEAGRRLRAQVMCGGTNDLARDKYKYTGISDCAAAARLDGGAKICPSGCLGLGTCAEGCNSGAIRLINGLAAVDFAQCAGCGECAAACPKGIIKMIPRDAPYWVGCSSPDRALALRKYCDAGCTGCRACEKECEAGAIKVVKNTAVIDYEKCLGCGKCEAVCPRRAIWRGNKLLGGK